MYLIHGHVHLFIKIDCYIKLVVAKDKNNELGNQLEPRSYIESHIPMYLRTCSTIIKINRTLKLLFWSKVLFLAY